MAMCDKMFNKAEVGIGESGRWTEARRLMSRHRRSDAVVFSRSKQSSSPSFEKMVKASELGGHRVGNHGIIRSHGDGYTRMASSSTAILPPEVFPIISSLVSLPSVQILDPPMSAAFWNPLETCEICEMGSGARGENMSCCGLIRSVALCKNLIKTQDLKQGHQKLARLCSSPFELPRL